MPNHARYEQDVLDADQLALTVRTRSPELGRLQDAEIAPLLDALRQARDKAKDQPSSADPAPSRLLAAAIRRVETERRKRNSLSGPADADGETARTAPAIKPPLAAQAAKPRRRAAASPRKPAGRKPAEARKTDLRTEPHRIAKPKSKPQAAAPAVTDVPADTAARKHPMPLSDTEKAAKQATRKAEKDATKAAEKEAAREARRAERKALKEAEKEQARVERRAQRKAEKDAERSAAKEAERAERKAARKSEKPAEEKPKADKVKADKPKAAKTKADKPKADKPKAGKGKEAGSKKAKQA